MPLGTEVNLGKGDVVLDAFAASSPLKGTFPPFLVHAYCGHSRQSRLLLRAVVMYVIVAVSFILHDSFPEQVAEGRIGNCRASVHREE